MPTFDIVILINWVGSGLIGFLFGVATTWVTFRFERKRDDIAWKREKEKLYIQFLHDKELLILEFEQKTKELEEQLQQQQIEHIRKDILKGVDNPIQAIRDLENMRERLTQLFAKIDEIEQIGKPQKSQAVYEGKGEVIVLDKRFGFFREFREKYKHLDIIVTSVISLALSWLFMKLLLWLYLLIPEPIKSVVDFILAALGLIIFVVIVLSLIMGVWILFEYNVLNRK